MRDDTGLPERLIEDLALALAVAPQSEWQGAVCSYGMVLQLLELCEQGFRQAGLHRSGSDLEALRITFLRGRAALGPLQSHPTAAAAVVRRGVGGRRQRLAERVPGRQQPGKRRILPRVSEPALTPASPAVVDTGRASPRRARPIANRRLPGA